MGDKIGRFEAWLKTNDVKMPEDVAVRMGEHGLGVYWVHEGVDGAPRVPSPASLDPINTSRTTPANHYSRKMLLLIILNDISNEFR